MTLPEAQGSARVPLAAAQAAFRQFPGRATALAYMDAAIETLETFTYPECAWYVEDFQKQMREIRDWLMNETAL